MAEPSFWKRLSEIKTPKALFDRIRKRTKRIHIVLIIGLLGVTTVSIFATSLLIPKELRGIANPRVFSITNDLVSDGQTPQAIPNHYFQLEITSPNNHAQTCGGHNNWIARSLSLLGFSSRAVIGLTSEISFKQANLAANSTQFTQAQGNRLYPVVFYERKYTGFSVQCDLIQVPIKPDGAWRRNTQWEKLDVTLASYTMLGSDAEEFVSMFGSQAMDQAQSDTETGSTLSKYTDLLKQTQTSSSSRSYSIPIPSLEDYTTGGISLCLSQPDNEQGTSQTACQPNEAYQIKLNYKRSLVKNWPQDKTLTPFGQALHYLDSVELTGQNQQIRNRAIDFARSSTTRWDYSLAHILQTIGRQNNWQTVLGGNSWLQIDEALERLQRWFGTEAGYTQDDALFATYHLAVNYFGIDLANLSRHGRSNWIKQYTNQLETVLNFPPGQEFYSSNNSTNTGSNSDAPDQTADPGNHPRPACLPFELTENQKKQTAPSGLKLDELTNNIINELINRFKKNHSLPLGVPKECGFSEDFKIVVEAPELLAHATLFSLTGQNTYDRVEFTGEDASDFIDKVFSMRLFCAYVPNKQTIKYTSDIRNLSVMIRAARSSSCDWSRTIKRQRRFKGYWRVDETPALIALPAEVYFSQIQTEENGGAKFMRINAIYIRSPSEHTQLPTSWPVGGPGTNIAKSCSFVARNSDLEKNLEDVLEESCDNGGGK